MRDTLPVLPSLVALMVVAPTATPVTSPLPETVAMAALLDAQAIDRPTSGRPFASSGVAVSCKVCPTETLAVVGFTVTEATGIGVTVTVAVPFLPPLAAVIVAVPAATPVTRPLADTVATAPALDAHITVRPVRGLPAESFGVAVSCTV